MGESKQKERLIYTSSGVTFKESAPTLSAALKKSSVPKGFEIVAIIQAAAVVTPSGDQPITAIIVGNRTAMKPAPEEL